MPPKARLIIVRPGSICTLVEQSRASMSTALRSNLADKPIDETLAELDARSKVVPSASVDGMAVGPFGVFSLEEECRNPQPHGESTQLVAGAPSPECLEPEEALPSVGSLDTLNDMHDFLDWPDLFDLDFTSDISLLQDFDGGFEEIITQRQTIDSQNPSDQQPTSDIVMLSQGNVTNASLVNASVALLPIVKRATPKDLRPEQAEILLRHFKDHVILHMQPAPLPKKSPWDIHLDSAIVTLARLTYMSSQAISHAALANLLALLALSARHLSTQQMGDGDAPQSHWQEFATKTIDEAKENLQSSLRNEIRGPNVAKYKEQLMAVLAMLAFATFYDRQQDARAYMVDAERLLRLRGLAKRNISRKARQLHHVYTWMRIIEESTYVLRNFQKVGPNTAIGTSRHFAKEPRRDLNNAGRGDPQYQPGPNPRLDDFLRFEPGSSDNDVEDMTQKDREVGLHDIHLEDTREFAETMYLDLYGIPETWLSLVSQTTRLANVMDSLNVNKDRRDVEFIELLERRKQRLENMVCSFAAMGPQTIEQSTSSGNIGTMDAPRHHMVRALNAALVILFYRRIRKVNAWILQEHVDNVIRALKDFEMSCQRANIEGPGSPWPAFLAGCEALNLAQREYLLGYLDRASAMTGFARLETARICMIEVWRRRDESTGGSAKRIRDQVWTWEHVSKECFLHVLLS
ncbi:arginine metabolism regulation protein II [Exophiala viscosa]|uniref:arginine metabolism regulation protein II n=1 Tax=Exophiala viscosa TaxID=2486360 RepID=UPI002193DD0E|nr:arginine metabolism regulation protein II [Exophiala viscosa]